MQPTTQSRRSKRYAIMVTLIALATALTLGFTFYLVGNHLSSAKNRSVQTVNSPIAHTVGLPVTGMPDAVVNIELKGIDRELANGAVISVKDDKNENACENVTVTDATTLPALNEGTYTVTVEAAPVATDGTLYACDPVTKEVPVKATSTQTVEFEFAAVSAEMMTEEQLAQAQTQLEAAGVPQEVITTVYETYTYIPDPTPQPTYTETWTYVETPQQPQQQTQPQQQQPQSQPQHQHSWVTKTEKTITGYAEQYATGFHCATCSAGLTSEVLYTFKNPHPSDEAEKLAEIYEHQRVAGHSGIILDYAPTYSKQPVYETVTYKVCTSCGTRG